MKLNGREVNDVEVDGVDSRDYPDFSDTYISHAVFADTGEELTDEQLEELMDQNSDAVWEMAFESCIP